MRVGWPPVTVVSDNPKRDLVWEQAVSSGHNFLEVAEAFKHLVPLIT